MHFSSSKLTSAHSCGGGCKFPISSKRASPSIRVVFKPLLMSHLPTLTHWAKQGGSPSWWGAHWEGIDVERGRIYLLVLYSNSYIKHFCWILYILCLIVTWKPERKYFLLTLLGIKGNWSSERWSNYIANHWQRQVTSVWMIAKFLFFLYSLPSDRQMTNLPNLFGPGGKNSSKMSFINIGKKKNLPLFVLEKKLCH